MSSPYKQADKSQYMRTKVNLSQTCQYSTWLRKPDPTHAYNIHSFIKTNEIAYGSHKPQYKMYTCPSLHKIPQFFSIIHFNFHSVHFNHSVEQKIPNSSPYFLFIVHLQRKYRNSSNARRHRSLRKRETFYNYNGHDKRGNLFPKHKSQYDGQNSICEKGIDRFVNEYTKPYAVFCKEG